MVSKPSELFEEGKVKLKELESKNDCAECGEKFNNYIWSELFCPKCDKVRMNRIDKNLREIIDDLD